MKSTRRRHVQFGTRREGNDAYASRIEYSLLVSSHKHGGSTIFEVNTEEFNYDEQ
jgi:hypothetical protein